MREDSARIYSACRAQLLDIIRILYLLNVLARVETVEIDGNSLLVPRRSTWTENEVSFFARQPAALV